MLCDLTVNTEKCRLGENKTQYLGFTVGEGKAEPVLTKVLAIDKVPTPKCKKDVQRFLGMVGYYRSFIPQFSELAAPLTDCLRGGKQGLCNWTGQCQSAFEKLKGVLCKAPVLCTPDFEKQFRVATDASGKGLDAVLSQDFEGEEHPILYMS